MTAELFMDSNPVVLRSTDKITTAAQQIMTHRYRSLPVVDNEDRFLGLLTVNCLLYLVLPKAATMAKGLDSMPYVRYGLDDLRDRLRGVLEQPVTICLKEDVMVVHPDTPTVETLLILYRARTGVPVVNKDTGRLVGVVSYYDVGAKIMEEGF